MLLLIMGNCISLALYDPLQEESSQHNQTLQQVGAHMVGVAGLPLHTRPACSSTPTAVLHARLTCLTSPARPCPLRRPGAERGLHC